MKKIWYYSIILCSAAVMLFATLAHAETQNGKLEQVDLMKCEVVVNGLTIKVPVYTTIVGEDRSGRDFNILIENLVQYIGYKVSCRYQERKDGLVADKMKVYTTR